MQPVLQTTGGHIGDVGSDLDLIAECLDEVLPRCQEVGLAENRVGMRQIEPFVQLDPFNAPLDVVDETNLQRQVAHSLETLGTPKVDSAKRAMAARTARPGASPASSVT